MYGRTVDYDRVHEATDRVSLAGFTSSRSGGLAASLVSGALVIADSASRQSVYVIVLLGRRRRGAERSRVEVEVARFGFDLSRADALRRGALRAARRGVRGCCLVPARVPSPVPALGVLHGKPDDHGGADRVLPRLRSHAIDLEPAYRRCRCDSCRRVAFAGPRHGCVRCTASSSSAGRRQTKRSGRLLPLALAAVPLYAPVVAFLAFAYDQISPFTLPLFFVPALAAQRFFGLYQDQRTLARELVDVNTTLERANLSFASALVATLDARDRYTAGHSGAVAVYARDIAARMGLSPSNSNSRTLCGLVHDIGKIGLPAGLAGEARGTYLEERREMQLHSEIGERILCECRHLFRNRSCCSSSP